MTARAASTTWSRAATAPRSVAVIGASDNADKVGGRPIQYMRRFGYAGRIFPINPTRREIQGLPSFPRLADAPDCPDLAIVAVPAAAAREAVQACATAGVSVAVVLTSGFGETGPQGRALQDEMAAIARAAGMRLIGPNTQGIANFGNGTIASFATLFGEIEAGDGPVAIVSQSGAMSVVPYAHLRRQGIGVRYTHATGNEADVTVADLAASVLDDPDVKLLLLYLETIKDPDALAAVAARAHQRKVPVLAVKAGRSERGAAAAQSHTGALASEERVVDAFLKRIGILRVDNMHSLVDTAGLFLAAKRPAGNRLLVVSNSGASCVMAADLAEQHELDLAPLSNSASEALAPVLPAFATAQNPLDLTGALLSNSGLFGAALGAVDKDATWDHALVALPNAGAGYDLAGFADATAAFVERSGTVAAVSTPNPVAARVFRDRGLPVFDHDSHAIAAMGQLARWGALHAAFDASTSELELGLPKLPDALVAPHAREHYASEWTSLQALAACGFPVPRMELCQNVEQARAAAERLGGVAVAKASSAHVPHKSEHGLVKLGLRGPEAVGEAVADLLRNVDALGVPRDGVIVAEMVRADIELILGARRVSKFGDVVTIGAGGTFVEALKDVAVVSAPFTAEAARRALESLRIAPLFAALRGQQAIDAEAIVDLMLRLAAVMQTAHPCVSSIDLNPVMVARGGAPVIADALIEYAKESQ